MKVSGFTFLRNASMLGYPFIQSILSILPICDEYIIAVGDGQDDTLEQIEALQNPKIRILRMQWNEKMGVKGFTYAQQKNAAHAACTGDWAFYLEGDEVIHEKDLPTIRAAMELHLSNPSIEALVFDFLHFYGNYNTLATGYRWCWRGVRVIRNTIRSISPDGLYFLVMKDKNRFLRYPKAAYVPATVYHYGWVRPQEAVNEKIRQIAKFWNEAPRAYRYGDIDPQCLAPFRGEHPAIMQPLIPAHREIFSANPDYKPTTQDRKARLLNHFHKIFGFHLKRVPYVLQ